MTPADPTRWQVAGCPGAKGKPVNLWRVVARILVINPFLEPGHGTACKTSVHVI